MATLQCFATFKKVKLQCFTAFMVWRNDLYRATAKTHTKNYNLRTSQKTTNFCFSVLQHTRNSLDGEARVLTPAESFTVDGYDTATKTVCEYQGSYFHSCRKCFQNQRHETRNCHPDRTVEEKYQATLKKTAMRVGGRLTFPLCRSRVREEMKKPLLEQLNMCGHSREERMLRGTWHTLEKKHELIKIHGLSLYTRESPYRSLC